MYPNDSVNTALFQSVQASFANCGIKLTGKPEPVSSFFVDLGNAPQNNKANEWDVAPGGLDPRLVRRQRPHGRPAVLPEPTAR